MRPLSASELLDIWEKGIGQNLVQQALMLLAAACPEIPIEKLALLSVGQRDGYLLTLREWTFGSKLVSLAICPNCSDRLELTFDVADIRVTSEADIAEILSLQVADYAVQFRLPNSLDLIALIGQKNVNPTQQMLLNHCLLDIQVNGETATKEQLPNHILESVVARMAASDPQADVQLKLNCPQCGHQWSATFDIVTFFWHEINTWANRILQQVHTIASAYGWRESDILAMSPQRRQLYLEMINK